MNNNLTIKQKVVLTGFMAMFEQAMAQQGWTLIDWTWVHENGAVHDMHDAAGFFISTGGQTIMPIG